MSKLRKSVNNVFDICLPEDISPVAKAIVTGNTSYLDDNIRDLYSNAGIAHMLAVSGLHTTIISVMISAFFTKILKFKKRYASLAVMPLMAVYLIFVGGKAAAARAVIMMEVIYFGDVINRKPDTLNSVGFAAFVLLIINPYQLFWSGFLLSFVTVSGLIFIADGIGKGRRLKDKAFAAVKTSFLTSAASFPVVSWFFYKIPVLGFIVNLITTPLIGIAVCFGMLAGIAGLFSIKAAVFLCGPVYIILKFYFIVCTFFTSLPISVLLTGKPTLMFCIAYYVIYPYRHNGQTCGKKFMDMKIVKRDGSDIDLKSLCKRQILGCIILEGCLIPGGSYVCQLLSLAAGYDLTLVLGVASGVICLLSIYIAMKKKSRRMIHDYLADTKVVAIEK